MGGESQSAKDLKTAILPMLSVRNGAKAVEFYKAVFGAAELFRLDDPGGAVVARLSVDGAEFWVADESPEHLKFQPPSLLATDSAHGDGRERSGRFFQTCWRQAPPSFGPSATSMAGG